MENRISLPLPIICFYEGMLISRSIKVYEVIVSDNGEPYRILAKDVNYLKGQAAPYDYKHLDEDSKESIIRSLKQAKLL